MPVYTWEGRTRQGTTKKGVMEAIGEAAVMAQLRAQMITPIAVKAKPKDLLEYVIVHEMAHLLVPTHSERFTNILDKHYPAWREARAELNELPLAAV